ncbi:MAG: hypothetical protein AAF587_29350 [Bacteroidota bacterium]
MMATLTNINDLSDPVARKTTWTPLIKGGSSFKSHQVHLISESKMQVKISLSMKLFIGLFYVAAAFLVGIWGYVEGVKGVEMGAGRYASILLGAVFGGIGVWIWYSVAQTIVFDSAAGQFIKGEQTLALDDIYAIQLIAEQVMGMGTQGSYPSYELNLVLQDGQRINVMDHASLNSIRKDAEALTSFLNVQLWDTIEP